MRYADQKIKSQPSISEISDRWRESIALESLAPAGLRGGLARTRTALLEAVPQWERPAFLDAVQGSTA